MDGDENYCSVRIATYLDGSVVYISRDFEPSEGNQIGCRYQGEYYVSFVLKYAYFAFASFLCIFRWYVRVMKMVAM